ncbi:hypothetical protein [Parendozoicomonas haliclonae]|uniref:Uncharacterized protein n=1 Tax=Parendozoicomonas haliclonae TaxID=1960125 RepID=A0A1X7APE6_9GAMM|nr:hypothetical protein [Parendozoicomonas haliclonae]SMA49992.1 hypothetical protein EHSB41UT_03783 [Parendozoicomonas haliclonae]
MSVGSSGVQSTPTGAPQGIPGNQNPAAKGKVDNADADAFDNALGADQKVKEEKKLTPEEELKKAMAEHSVKQFMERSKEHTEETKKNFEG